MINRYIRNILLLVLSFALLLSFAACETTKKEKEEGPESLHTEPPRAEEFVGVITISSYSTSDNDTSVFMFLQEYILQYPGVDTTIDNSLDYDTYFATLDERVASGKIGDVFVIDSGRIAEYAEKNWIMDLSDMKNDLIDFTNDEYNKLVPEKLLFDAAYQSSLYNSRMYMCPTEYENKIVILNIDALQKAGIVDPVPVDEWTWTDVEVYCSKLKESGCKNVLSMDYSDYAIWGSFARSMGGSMYNLLDEATGEKALNLADSKNILGLKYLADTFIRPGYIADKTPELIKAEELKDYGIIVASHSDLARWSSFLENEKVKEKEDSSYESYSWELAHFPRFANTDINNKEQYFHNIGINTLGLAVLNREQIDKENNVNILDPSMDNYEELKKEKEYNYENLFDIASSIALYALIDDAATELAGSQGFKVPALISANNKKFWREFPVKGKNTSVFSLYSSYDFTAELTTFMKLDAANEINDALGMVLLQYVEDDSIVNLDDLIQEIQDNANASW